ncbi:MAG TPA: NAD(+)/NADH kinase [Thermoleophilaceae bacterium]|nr:NAD(+)/NADH kinase [Thermoleophilaceae bacterium]
MTTPRRITLFTHSDSGDTTEAVRRLLEEARRAGIEVVVPASESEKHGLGAGDGVTVVDAPDDDTDLAVVLGGDGTILRALREYAGMRVPVFAFNYGTIGFLATVDGHELDDGLRRVVEGDFATVSMPALAIEVDGTTRLAAADVSFHRRPHARVAELAYSVEGEQLGKVRCDGLVAATPAGSTGYNLANGGPLLAWGVEGFVVSFIAPHSLTARAVVVAPDTPLSVVNCSDREAVDVTTDGQIARELGPASKLEVRFEHQKVHLAQVPSTGFYDRLRQKFGRIAY